ncbi:suprabasin isoform X3 [Babesia caballi]|uniref:Suprabasin isoform X3 n=1 Tax=Babesia caballi TaxID=5871 RepID=A0AAV4LXM5_BABCB|nr:suprabasin isoform X3 [Babesia caballi]
MGYETNKLSTSGTGGDIIMDKVASELDELENGSSSPNDYLGFLQEFEVQIASIGALRCPLVSCFLFADKYFASKNASGINDAINKLKTKFEEFSRKPESHTSYVSSNPYDELKDLIKILLQIFSSFKPKEREEVGQGVHHAAGQAGKEIQKSISAQTSPSPAVSSVLELWKPAQPMVST